MFEARSEVRCRTCRRRLAKDTYLTTRSICDQSFAHEHEICESDGSLPLHPCTHLSYAAARITSQSSDIGTPSRHSPGLPLAHSRYLLPLWSETAHLHANARHHLFRGVICQTSRIRKSHSDNGASNVRHIGTKARSNESSTI